MDPFRVLGFASLLTFLCLKLVDVLATSGLFCTFSSPFWLP